MTTYNGRSAQYVPGREVPNKEPPVSRYVVEKLYRVHRERVLKVEPTIDSHVKIPDFLVNQTWKKNAEKQKKVVITKENQDIYGRIEKVENSQSTITKENQVHVKRVEAKLSYLRKLKEHGRLVNLVKIQKENELLLRRLEKAKPQYTLKKCKDWYKHHELYKAGRRTDPTAGHIMYGMKGLLPNCLPPLSTTFATTLDKGDSITTLSKDILKSTTLASLDGSMQRSQLASNSIMSTSVNESYAVDYQRSSSAPEVVFAQKGFPNIGISSTVPIHMSSAEIIESVAGMEALNDSVPSHSEASFAEDDLMMDQQHCSEVGLNGGYSSEPALDDMLLVSSRTFPLPFDSKNCLVQVYVPRCYDENLRLRVVSSGMNPVILAERSIPIDKVYEIFNSSGESGQIMHSTENADLQELSTLLINKFKEADEDGSGSLTFDQFQTLMEQVDLGISPQELRFVICEADENENGVVDYEEFVPLAVDLIRSFRARNRAKTISSQEEVLVDDKILQTISATDLQHATQKCLEKIYEFDTKKYGLIRVPDLKRCLGTVAGTVGIADSETSMLCQMLPRDQFGRIKYNATSTTFYDTLSKVRFITMKNAIIESQGSGLQKYLLDLCKEEERRLASYTDINTSTANSTSSVSNNDSSKFVPTGILQCRSLINILSNSPRLSLNRLQVLVIMSEASVLDGMINYFQFIPVVAKAIELMFEPKALRERAELIEKTDLSPEALLQGMSSEMFEQRLLTLFKSYDIDHNGTLDHNEFIACLESLELQLTYGEMEALMAAADVAQHGFLKFEDFVGFFTHNLLNLEREKHIRLLQNSLRNKTSGDIVSNFRSESTKPKISQDLADQLLAIFKLYDLEHTGFIPFEEFENILQNLINNVSKFLIDVLLSELQVNNEGYIEYVKAVSTCTELFKVYQAQETYLEEVKLREQEVESKAQKIVDGLSEEIHHIVKFLMRKIKQINEASQDLISKYQEMKDVVCSSHSGLSRNEANFLLTTLFMGISYNKIQNMKSSSEDDYVKSLNEWSFNDKPLRVYSNNSADNTHSQGSPTNINMEDGEKGCSTAAPETIDANRHFKAPTPKFRNCMKSFRLQFSSQELFDAILEAKKHTIMRSLLQQIDTTSINKLLLSSLNEELRKRQDFKEIPVDSTYLPVQICYNIISKVDELRLNRAQIMYIISLADCYDSEGKNLEIYRFSELASNIAAELHHGDILETRAEIILNSNLDDRKTFHGMRERELFDELHSKFQSHVNERHQYSVDNKSIPLDRSFKTIYEETTTASDSNIYIAEPVQYQVAFDRSENIVDIDEIRSVLRNLNKLKLTERDINTIIVGLEMPNDQEISWMDIIQPVIEAIRALNREQLIHRRLSLAATAMQLQINEFSSGIQDTPKKLHEESFRILKQLSDKLLNYVKIVAHADGNVHIQLPKEHGNAILRRTSSQILTYKDDILSIMPSDSIDHHEITSLHKGAMFMKLVKITSPLPNDNKFKKNSFKERDFVHGHPVASTGNIGSIPSLQLAQSLSASRLVASSTSRPSSSISKGKNGSSPHTMETRLESRVPIFVHILAVEDTRFFSSCSLVANIISADGSFHGCESLQMKLPSIGLVDREAAQQFAVNLIDRMYLESRLENDYRPKLCMYEQ